MTETHNLIPVVISRIVAARIVVPHILIVADEVCG
jgi:hypothetical protein